MIFTVLVSIFFNYNISRVPVIITPSTWKSYNNPMDFAISIQRGCRIDSPFCYSSVIFSSYLSQLSSAIHNNEYIKHKQDSKQDT